MYNMYMLPMVIEAGNTEGTSSPDIAAFRPNRLRTRIEKPGVCIITGVFVNEDPMMRGRIDAYEFSIKLEAERYQAFLVEYGLVGKTPHEIDDYCDENDISLPMGPSFPCATLKKGDKLRVVGEFKETLHLVFSGVGASELL